MRKMNRFPAPLFLAQNWEDWGIDFEQRREQNPSYRFSWKTLDGQAIDKQLLPLLRRMTQTHCVYCDNFPLGSASRETIEHFKPKSLFPREVYFWENLFLCCDKCQNAKLEKYDLLLLKPDSQEYKFNEYFIFDFVSGKLSAKPNTPKIFQDRANKTIEILQLNRKELCKMRLREGKVFESTDFELDDYNFRFLFD